MEVPHSIKITAIGLLCAVMICQSENSFFSNDAWSISNPSGWHLGICLADLLLVWRRPLKSLFDEIGEFFNTAQWRRDTP